MFGKLVTIITVFLILAVINVRNEETKRTDNIMNCFHDEIIKKHNFNGLFNATCHHALKNANDNEEFYSELKKYFIKEIKSFISCVKKNNNSTADNMPYGPKSNKPYREQECTKHLKIKPKNCKVWINELHECMKIQCNDARKNYKDDPEILTPINEICEWTEKK
ncbi:uncharacterized protein [Centruroides vittatus]|uniref:uncharacterized protein n=1 Tax=Centruroides vittatus TaxID=120091 RepID=UPI003510AF6C